MVPAYEGMNMRNQQGLTVNVDAATIVRLDEHVSRHRPFLRRHGVHRVALNLGLAVLDRNPELLIKVLEQESGPVTP